MIKKFIRDCGGNNLVEGALVTPLLLMLTFGIVDFATMFYVYVSMESGISQATRFAVTGATKDDPDHPGTPMGSEGTIRAAMAEAAPTLNVDASASTGNIISYTWDLSWTTASPDRVTQLPTTSFTVQEFNRGTITLTVTDANGNTATVTHTYP